MKPEVYISYIVPLKYNFSFQELMALRYSTEANDRVKYEMLILTVIKDFKDLNTNLALHMPADFSDFIETYMPLSQEWAREKFIRLISK